MCGRALAGGLVHLPATRPGRPPPGRRPPRASAPPPGGAARRPTRAASPATAPRPATRTHTHMHAMHVAVSLASVPRDLTYARPYWALYRPIDVCKHSAAPTTALSSSQDRWRRCLQPATHRAHRPVAVQHGEVGAGARRRAALHFGGGQRHPGGGALARRRLQAQQVTPQAAPVRAHQPGALLQLRQSRRPAAATTARAPASTDCQHPTCVNVSDDQRCGILRCPPARQWTSPARHACATSRSSKARRAKHAPVCQVVLQGLGARLHQPHGGLLLGAAVAQAGHQPLHLPLQILRPIARCHAASERPRQLRTGPALKACVLLPLRCAAMAAPRRRGGGEAQASVQAWACGRAGRRTP